MKLYAAVLPFLFLPLAAWGQGAVVQSGVVVPGDFASWIGNGIVKDSGVNSITLNFPSIATGDLTVGGTFGVTGAATLSGGGTLTGTFAGSPTFSGPFNTTSALGYQINGQTVLNIANGNFGTGNGWAPNCIGNCTTLVGALAGGNLPSTERLATLIGFNAGGHMNTITGSGNGTEATAVGWNSQGNITGSNQYFNTTLGVNTLGTCTTGCTLDIAIGTDAMRDVLSMTNTIAIGGSAGEEAKNDQSVFIGSNAGSGASGVLAGGNSVGIGFFVFNGPAMTSAFSSNVGIGSSVAASITSGSGNVFIGAFAAEVATSASNNVCIGLNACQAMTTAQSSVVIGAAAGAVVTSGQNVLIGFASGVALTNGTNESFLGFESGHAVTTGNGNALFGYLAGSTITTGGLNLVLGPNVGSTTLVSGGNNTLVGNTAACDTPLAATNDYLAICAGGGPIVWASGGNAPSTSIGGFAGAFQIGSATTVLASNEFGMAKISASGTAPGAGTMKFDVVAGTTGGTCKLITYAGTSTTPTTVIDNVGSGC